MSERRYGFIIYRNPEDYPGRHVARRFSVEYNPPRADAGRPLATGTLRVCRASIPTGLARIPRDATDPPAILETWI